MSSPLSKLQRRTRRTLRITLAWVIIGVLAGIWESNVMADHGLDPDRETVLDGHFWRSLFAGLIGGGLYIFVMRDRLRKLPYLPAFGIMSALVLVAVTFTYAVLPVLMVGDPAFLPAFIERSLSWHLIGHFLFWDLVMGMTMLMVRLNDQFGSGTAGFLLGRYFKPRQELRIFMFLDMRSSTAIAEEIGDTRYFQLLNEVYADITDPVIYSEGDIYQYVGDEISVSWQLHRGIKGQRCLLTSRFRFSNSRNKSSKP